MIASVGPKRVSSILYAPVSALFGRQDAVAIRLSMAAVQTAIQLIVFIFICCILSLEEK